MDGAINVVDLSPTARELLADSLAGLRAEQKRLSPKWLYDQRGSALFEQITALPEYYLTRTEAAVLRDHADRLVGMVPEGGALVELGSGASVKTRTLLDAGEHLGAYVPIDISADFLHLTADDLRQRYPKLEIHPVVGDFTGPVDLPDILSDTPKIGFFPGSTIGNLDPFLGQELLANARGWDHAEGFILGADFVKDPNVLVAAYDDKQGVTAKFISNILLRLNDDLGADFDTEGFAYEARWNDSASRIDMLLISRRDQVVDICGTKINFAQEEPIYVSSARKYTRASLAQLAAASGWVIDDILTDAEDKFGVCLLTPS